MLTGLLLLFIGVADLLYSSARSARLAAGTTAVTWTALAVGATLLLSVHIGWVLLVIVAAAAWLCAMTSPTDTPAGQRRLGLPEVGPSRRGPIWAASALVAVLLAALLFDRTANAAGSPVTHALANAPFASIRDITAVTAVTALGAAIFLLESSNVIVRSALRQERHASATDGVAEKPLLRGGTWIGALERLSIFALVATPAQAVVVAIIAAKGVIRFPEISRNSEGGGEKAEYFLVGSLVSWTIALAMTGIVLVVTLR
jgi:hypothetical protein